MMNRRSLLKSLALGVSSVGAGFVRPVRLEAALPPVRDEQALEEIPKLRKMTTCPLAHGEEWGQRWDFHRLVYEKDIDYIRATLPNVGGITETATHTAVLTDR